jgi:transposase
MGLGIASNEPSQDVPRRRQVSGIKRASDGSSPGPGATHRRAGTFAPAGAKLFFMPKYSPDLNPIEQVFAELKRLLRGPPREPSLRSVQLWENFSML